MLTVLAFLMFVATSDERPLSQQTIATCFSENANPSDQVEACTVLLKTGEAQGDQKGQQTRAAALYGRAAAYRRAGELDESIDDLDALTELLPSAPEVLILRGVNYYDKGQYDRAIKDFDHALEMNPKSGEAYMERGMAYRMKDQYPQALSDYDRALKLLPDNPTVLNNRAWAYYALRKNDEALADIERVHAIPFENAGTQDTHAHILAALGRQDEAMKAFRRTMDLGGAARIKDYQQLLTSRHGYDDLEVDGKMTAATLQALEDCVRKGCRLRE